MAKGRKPKPVEQRRREGNPGKRPLPEPVRVAGKPSSPPKAPASLPPAGREIWDAVVPHLHELGVLDTVDVFALEAMCTQWARSRQAGRVIAEQGHVALGSTGQIVEHPSLATERSAHKLFLQFAEQYALTPSARVRLGLSELQRRTLAREMDEALGEEDVVDAEEEIVDAQVA